MISGVTVIQQQQQQISFFFWCVRFENSKDPKMAKFFQHFARTSFLGARNLMGAKGNLKNCRNLLFQDYWNIP